jgi:hypothetical protein
VQKVVLAIIAAALILAANFLISAPASAQEKGPGAKVVAPADAKAPTGAVPAPQKKQQLGFISNPVFGRVDRHHHHAGADWTLPDGGLSRV